MSNDKHARRPPAEDRQRARTRTATRTRGLLKVVFVTMAVSQVLTTLFVALTHIVSSGVTAASALIFNSATCMLVSYWLQSDAKRAWLHARAHGFIKPGDGDAQPAAQVATECPKRWLVVLYAELNPGLLTQE